MQKKTDTDLTRCRECIHGVHLGGGHETLHCDWWNREVINNGFCNYGEKNSFEKSREWERKKEQFFDDFIKQLKERGTI